MRKNNVKQIRSIIYFSSISDAASFDDLLRSSQVQVEEYYGKEPGSTYQPFQNVWL
jgi:hypothetical protein